MPEIALGAPAPAAVASRALVRDLDPHAPVPRGLAGRTVAVWPSHGLYYEASRRTWEWQRAHLFTTIEDLLAYSVVQPYLAPMLERAGAVVLLPRERDTQTDEVVADADASPAATPGSGPARGRVGEQGAWRDGGVGYRYAPVIRGRQNPFAEGTSRVAETALAATAETVWEMDLRTPAEYAVTVAYTADAGRATDARYTVEHAGGTTRVAVNQTMGGGTWVRLGQFRFAPGRARVTLTNESATPGRTVSADAVRWGGGMGSVERGGAPSGRPRWTEAGRYYAQFAGFPPEVWAPEDDRDDYKDDYKSRGEWVNGLLGAPAGPNGAADLPGLRVPVDAALALHTDAGITADSTVEGTLAIYHTRSVEGEPTFPDGRPRALSGDLARSVQGQIVADLRALYDPLWTQRDARNRNYSEAARPNVPTVLIELLSHQNLTDVRFALDPRFRHDAARAVYKGLGRFLAREARTPFVPQPLAPEHLSALFDTAGNVAVRWRPVRDPAEPLAAPDAYVVYTRLGEGGWDGGRRVAETETTLRPPPPGVVLSVRVAALNAGGASGPSEALAVGLSGDSRPPVLVVAGFDRVAAPEIFQSDIAAGVRGDDGVADVLDLAFTGDQIDFDPASAYVDDDRPGHGASRGDSDALLAAGNTHDFAAVHGRALLAAGRSFVSASDETVEDGTVPLGAFPVVDVLLGEEKTTAAPGWRPLRGPDFEALPDAMRRRLADHLRGGGKVLLSGAHWATDTARTPAGASFLRDFLGATAVSDDGARAGGVADGVVEGPMLGAARVFVNTAPRPDLYAVEAPDGLAAAGPGALALSYARTGTGAGVVVPGHSVVLGFPIEALVNDADRAAVVAAAFAALGE